jgi:hypothetical protein
LKPSGAAGNPVHPLKNADQEHDKLRLEASHGIGRPELEALRKWAHPSRFLRGAPFTAQLSAAAIEQEASEFTLRTPVVTYPVADQE